MLVTALYLVIAARMIVLACGQLSFPGLLFLASPAALTFPINDIDGFGRKDVVMICAFLLALTIVKYVPRVPLAFVLMALLYFVTGLVHEMAWIYFPVAISFLLATRGRDFDAPTIRRIIIATVACLAAGILFAVFSKGTPETTAAMIAAWQRYVPNAFVPPGAADYLHHSFYMGLGFTIVQVGAVATVLFYLVASALASVPVVALALERPPLSHPLLGRRVYVVPLILMAGTFFTAADWGRIIHLFWMHAFIFLVSLGPAVAPKSETSPPFPVPGDRKTPIYAGAFIFLYATTWILAHSVLRTVNPFWPGHIFSLKDWLIPL